MSLATPKRMNSSPVPVQLTGDGLVVRVGAGADDWRIADAAEPLARHAAGAGGGGEVAFHVERDATDGAFAIFCRCGGRDRLGGPLGELLLELFQTLRRVEVAVRHAFDVHEVGELFRACAHHQDVLALLHDEPREADRAF